jgi:hypothetical protein
MRRPVKPFVTEYKGPNRRPGHPGAAAQRLQSEEFSYATAAQDVFARPAPDAPRNAPEDSYEAAMRAADALFAPTAAKAASPVARPPRIELTAAAAHHQPDTEAEPANHAHGGGRILRAIDEQPMLDLAEPGAERVPMRRGRKPGSKNKPKAPVFVDDAPKALPSARPAPSAPPLVFRDAPADSAGSAPVPAPRSREATAYRSRDPLRFAWVRTKLKPGEEWKRRLPKVCW